MFEPILNDKTAQAYMIFLWGKMCLLYSLLGCPSKTKLLLHEVPEGSVLGPTMPPLFFLFFTNGHSKVILWRITLTQTK